jgi:hypothetical protein
VADANVKVDLKKLEVVDEIPTHYRTGHIAISADNSYVMALNKFSTGLFSPTGVVYPVNFEMWDAREKSPTYGKTLKITPGRRRAAQRQEPDGLPGEGLDAGRSRAGRTAEGRLHAVLDPVHRATR